MAKYNVTYKCGHEDSVELFGSTRAVEHRMEQMGQDLCPECKRKQREELADYYDKEHVLPELTGSEKQVEWARNIRRECLLNFEKLCEEWEKCELEEVGEILCIFDDSEYESRYKEYADMIYDAIDYISEQTTARFFIDNRYDFPSKNVEIYSLGGIGNLPRDIKRWAKLYRDDHDVQKIEAKKAEKEAKKAEKEMEEKMQITVIPEDKKRKTVVTLRKKDDKVHLFSDYNSTLVDVIHNFPFKMKWNKVSWEFSVEEFRGTIDSVIAEIGNILLSKGFTVVFPDKMSADMASSGGFKRYIRNAFYDLENTTDKISLIYDDNDDTLRWHLRFVKKVGMEMDRFVFNVSDYDLIEELMETNPDTFAMSDACKAKIEAYKKTLMVVKPVEIENVVYNKPVRKDVDLSDLNDD